MIQELNETVGQKISRSGFRAEHVFKEFIEAPEGIQWLKEYTGIVSDSITAKVLSNGSKIDVLAEVKIKDEKKTIGFSLKKTEADFNQIERRSVKRYAEVFNFSEECTRLLNLFVGKIPPSDYTDSKTKSSKRMFLNEFSETDQKIVINEFKKNISFIIDKALRGSDKLKPDFLVLSKNGKDFANAKCLSMQTVIDKLINGAEVKISPRGSLILGGVTIQRKGGDGGAESAKDLQIKLKPSMLSF